MGTKPIPEKYARAGTADAERGRPATETGRAGDPADPVAGSVWWADLSLGAACYLAAALLALAHTALGPFAGVTVVYPTTVATLCLAVALFLGTIFFRSGVRKA